jgi:hypothetical protein
MNNNRLILIPKSDLDSVISFFDRFDITDYKGYPLSKIYYDCVPIRAFVFELGPSINLFQVIILGAICGSKIINASFINSNN